MSSLSINGTTTVTNSSTTLNVGVVSGSRIGVVTITGPIGPQGVDGSGAGGGAGISSVNGLTGAINLVGTGLVSITSIGQNILISGMNTTGQSVANISGYITTGQADQRYYPLLTNPSRYLISGDPFSIALESDYDTVDLGIELTNANAAISTNQSYSPFIQQEAFGWHSLPFISPGSESIRFRYGVRPIGAGSTQSYGLWAMQSSLNSGEWSDVMTVDISGQLFANDIIANNSIFSPLLTANTIVANTGIIEFNNLLSFGSKLVLNAGVNTGVTSLTLSVPTGNPILTILGDTMISGSGFAYQGNITTLTNMLTGMSGQANTNYATVNNLLSTGSMAWNAANNNGINLSGNAAVSGTTLRGNIIATSGSLASTGQSVYNYITATSGFATGASGSLDSRLTSTGLSIGLVSGALDTRITATGAALSAVKVSGSAIIPIADFTGIGTTVVLYSGGKVFISGAPSSAGSNADGINISGNLTTTGTLLSAVKVSGSSIINTANFTGLGSTVITYDGTYVRVSGVPAGTGAGVQNINGAINVLSLIGTGGMQVFTNGQQLVVSGFGGVSNANVLFSAIGNITGDNRFNWNTGSGSLVLGSGVVILPQNPLAIAGSGNTYFQVNIQNSSSGTSAQSDYVLTSDIGTDSSYFVDLGINNTKFADTGYQLYKPLDGFLYNRGGDMFIGAAGTTGQVRFHTAGIQSGHLRASISNSGIQIPNTGIISFDGGLSLDTRSITIASGILSFTGIANNPIAGMYASGWGSSLYGTAWHSRRIKAILPQLTTTQQVWGDTAANVGTLSTDTSELFGDTMRFTPAAGLSAGSAYTTASIYRGTQVGAGNGFFFVSKFSLTGNMPGVSPLGGGYSTSGSRIFVGLTDQAVATQVQLNDPIGNFVGLQYLWASGGSVGTGQYMQNWAITSRNNVSTSTGNTSMSFATGSYRFGMFCPVHPNNGTIFYQLDDLGRGSGIQGTITSTLPVGSTAMRALAAIGFVTGLWPLGIQCLYTEIPSSRGQG